jgi:hypothetical protein
LLSFRALFLIAKLSFEQSEGLVSFFIAEVRLFPESSLNLEADFSNLQGCPGICCHTGIWFGVMVETDIGT